MDQRINSLAACPVCANSARNLFKEDPQWPSYRCSDCGTVYLDPMPDAAALAALYTDAYEGAATGYFSKPEKKLRRSRGRIRLLRKFMPSPARFLDIGCNGGFMTEAAREAGYDAWGIEPDPVSISYARTHFTQCHFTEGTIEGFSPTNPDGAPLQFDLAYCSEVIEHIPEPASFLAHVHRLLKPGAIFYLTTPDISHPRRPRDVTAWDGYCPPSHCIYFTPKSLTRLLGACGFSVIRKQIAFKPGIKLIARRDDRPDRV